jgi:hypothetical protein
VRNPTFAKAGLSGRPTDYFGQSIFEDGRETGWEQAAKIFAYNGSPLWVDPSTENVWTHLLVGHTKKFHATKFIGISNAQVKESPAQGWISGNMQGVFAGKLNPGEANINELKGSILSYPLFRTLHGQPSWTYISTSLYGSRSEGQSMIPEWPPPGGFLWNYLTFVEDCIANYFSQCQLLGLLGIQHFYLIFQIYLQVLLRGQIITGYYLIMRIL